MSFSGRKFSVSRTPGSRFATRLLKPPTPHACNLVRELTQILLTCSEVDSKIHRQFRSAHEGHRAHAGLDPSRASTGVVWCTERANEHGFSDDPSSWA